MNFEALSAVAFTLLPDTKACEVNWERHAFGDGNKRLPAGGNIPLYDNRGHSFDFERIS